MRARQTSTSVKRLVVTAIFMAMNIVLSSFGIPVPGGHLYLCDVVICLASILLNPIEAVFAAGIGSFLGDMLFYPAPMFVSLITHGIQAAVISCFSHYVLKSHPVAASGIGVAIGALIMVLGYTLGKIYIYSTFEYAIIKLPYEVMQATVGAVFGMILCWKCGIHRMFENAMADSEQYPMYQRRQ